MPGPLHQWSNHNFPVSACRKCGQIKAEWRGGNCTVPSGTRRTWICAACGHTKDRHFGAIDNKGPCKDCACAYFTAEAPPAKHVPIHGKSESHEGEA